LKCGPIRRRAVLRNTLQIAEATALHPILGASSISNLDLSPLL